MGRHGNRNSEGFDDPTACEKYLVRKSAVLFQLVQQI